MEPKEQWRACKSSACLVPQKRGLIEISGSDRGQFLQGLFSQDVVKDFPVGRVTYGVFPNIKGRITADAYVAHIDGNRFLLDVESSALKTLLDLLERYLILLKAQIQELKGHVRYSLLGPQAQSLLEKSLGKSIAIEGSTVLNGKSGFVFGVKRPNWNEFQIWLSDQQVKKFESSMTERACAIAREGIFELLQIEARIPKLGREMDETTFPQEVGLEETLNFKKGCFVGAEVLQRIFYQGHVNRTLALFFLESDTAIPRGAAIKQGNSDVGKITATAFSFEREKQIALGLLKQSALENTDELYIDTDGTKIGLKLIATPL